LTEQMLSAFLLVKANGCLNGLSTSELAAALSPTAFFLLDMDETSDQTESILSIAR
jgi:hypothetical protein